MYLRCSLFSTIYSIFLCTLSFYNDIWLILCMYVSINKCNYLIELRQRHISKLIQAPTCIYLVLASIWVCIMWLKCVLYIVVKGPGWRHLLLTQGETSMIRFFLDSVFFIIIINHITFYPLGYCSTHKPKYILNFGNLFFSANFKINRGRNQVMRYWTISMVISRPSTTGYVYMNRT